MSMMTKMIMAKQAEQQAMLKDAQTKLAESAGTGGTDDATKKIKEQEGVQGNMTAEQEKAYKEHLAVYEEHKKVREAEEAKAKAEAEADKKPADDAKKEAVQKHLEALRALGVTVKAESEADGKTLADADDDFLKDLEKDPFAEDEFSTDDEIVLSGEDELELDDLLDDDTILMSEAIVRIDAIRERAKNRVAGTKVKENTEQGTQAKPEAEQKAPTSFKTDSSYIGQALKESEGTKGSKVAESTLGAEGFDFPVGGRFR